ncbi:MAG: ArsR/SmtB family transcription factor [Candidatus Limnocylindrales bacterium]
MLTHESAVALGALSDPTRRRVFEQLRAGPMAVGEIARTLPVSRPAVSQHLRVLKVAGLVQDRADGARRLYSLDPHGLTALRSYVEEFWEAALGEYERAATELGIRRDTGAGRTGKERKR